MTPRAKSLIALSGTLLLGVVLGVLVGGLVAQQRSRQIRDLREGGGFVENMERIIVPRSQAQRDAMRPVLAQTDAQNRAILADARERLREAIVEMRGDLDSLLSPEQLERLDRFIQRPPPVEPLPGGPPPGRRPPRIP